MKIHDRLKVTRWQEPIGSGTCYGVAMQRMSDVTGHIEVLLSLEDFAKWLEAYRTKETGIEDWILKELGGWELECEVRQICLDSQPVADEKCVRVNVSVEDWG